ncbi:MAG: Transcriptional activator HlyU domain-containing protein [Candidatus Tokpelaia hoelldobleri]|uniref:Transcriptional activator HlyU domain-containing protein n=1 Tax=Candidatus Tokpelaia hoelldobleri TaxID=1902579 RepID=A0A1U9JUY1_9HYPH|nr:MAG: Transcriptional activator HlyU domain-containing protein [Candidatus Tokpelaia hoelldoblerii]
MSFLKKLFGFGAAATADIVVVAPEVDYQGFTIQPLPEPVDGQYQCSGVIKKTIDGQVREHRFIRADKFPALEDANRMVVIKAQRLIDEQGEQLFSDNAFEA